MGSEKIKFVVVGCGHIGKRHAYMINQNENAQLVGLVDQDPLNSATLEAQFSTKFIGDFDLFIQSKLDVDIVCICTPNGLHAYQSVKCLEAGYHVVCEKPMALSVSDCEKVLSASKTFQRNFFCVTQNRYSPPAQWLHEIIAGNKLGEIYVVQVTGFWNRNNRYYKNSWKGTIGLDGGTLFTQFSHFVDTLHWLFGQIQITGATLKNFNHTSIEFEDTGLFTFSLPHGGIGSFSYSTSIWDKNMESTITIIGENGTVKVGGQYMEDVVYCHIKDYQFEPQKLAAVPVTFGTYSGSAANHYLLINDVIKALNGFPTQLASTEECVSVVKTISDVYSFK